MSAYPPQEHELRLNSSSNPFIDRQSYSTLHVFQQPSAEAGPSAQPSRDNHQYEMPQVRNFYREQNGERALLVAANRGAARHLLIPSSPKFWFTSTTNRGKHLIVGHQILRVPPTDARHTSVTQADIICRQVVTGVHVL